MREIGRQEGSRQSNDCSLIGARQERGKINPGFSPEFWILGQAGKAGWLIARRGRAVAMGRTEIEKGPENLFHVERIAQEWATLDKQVKQGELRVEVEMTVLPFSSVLR